MRAKICFLIVITYSSNILVSWGDVVDGDIELDDKGIVSVYNRHYGAFLNICWIKNKSERYSITNTICRQMGLAETKSSTKMKPKSKSKFHNHKITVESCTDDASHIYRCDYHLETFCSNIIAVTCAQTKYVYEGQLRLRPMDENTRITRSFSEGMLVVFLNNRSTFVCNETFGENEATTACRQLGYTTARTHSGEISYGQNKVWIGFNKQIGRVDCDEPEDCLTKCYSKPAHEEYCESGIMVYLQCDFVIQNLNSEQSTAGSPSACAIKEISESKNSAVVGIVLGSISLIFICIFGILIALYCGSTGAKKPHNDSSHDQFDYSYANDRLLESFKESNSEEEHETSFNENVEYRPPVITQLAENNNSDN